jgi:hypothetical protein
VTRSGKRQAECLTTAARRFTPLRHGGAQASAFSSIDFRNEKGPERTRAQGRLPAPADGCRRPMA